MKVLLASLHGFIPEVIYPEYLFCAHLGKTDHQIHVLRTGPENPVFPGRSLLHQDPLDLSMDAVHSNLHRFEEDLEHRFTHFYFHNIRDYLQQEDLLSMESFLGQTDIHENLENFSSILVDGIPLGQCSIFLALRRTMIGSLEDMDEPSRLSFIMQLKACYLSLRLIQNVWKKSGGFDALVASHFNYPLTKLIYWFCSQQNSKLHFQLLTVPNLMGQKQGFRYCVFEQMREPLDDYFENYNKRKPFPLLQTEKIQKHFEFMFAGKSRIGYSKAIGIQAGQFFRLWNFDRERPLFVAYLSGSQERFAAQLAGCESRGEYLFDSQLQWIDRLVKEFSDSDSQLVIRPHPREYIKEKPTKLIEELLNQSKFWPENIHLNTPDEEISSYDLMLHASAVLVSWSTTTIEAGLLGIPVLGYMKDHDTYPMWDLGHIPDSREDYILLLRKWLRDEPSHCLEYSMAALRWFSYYLNIAHVDMESVLNFKRWVYSEWTDRYIREFRKLSDAFYNPVYLEDSLDTDIQRLLKISFEERKSLVRLQSESLQLKPEADQSESEILMSVLYSLARQLFSIPEGFKVKVHKDILSEAAQDSKAGPGEIHFKLLSDASSHDSTKRCGKVRSVFPHQRLLKFFCEKVFL